MTLVNAIKVLFGKTAPACADFDGAFNVLKGKKDTDLSQADATTLDELAETFQDFVGDPARWLKKASATDPRHSWWVQLAQALGASVMSGPAPASATPSSSPRTVASDAPADPAVTEPEQGIDPDALAGGAPPPGRRESGGGTGGRGFSISTDYEGEEGGDKDDDRPPERQKRRPPPSSVSRTVAPRIVAILGTESFQEHRARILTLFQSIREGDSDAQDELVQLERELRKVVRSMPTGYLVMASAELALDMIASLRAGKDQSESAWFQANYVTGSYS